MMDAVRARADRFVESATVPKLKAKLAELGLSTLGLKPTLKLRLEEGIALLDVSRLEELFSIDGIDEESDEEENVSESDLAEQDRAVSERLESLRALVRKKEEIAILERKLAELCKPQKEVESAAYTFRDVEDTVPNFSGDDSFPVKKWISNFEDARVMFRFSESESFLYAKRLLTGTAKLCSRSALCHSWNELKNMLLAEFHDHATATDVHNILRGRKKQKDESFQQYLLVMQEIASQVDIEEVDVMNYIIRGIPDSFFNKQILLTANNMTELKKLLKKYEKMIPEPYTPVQKSTAQAKVLASSSSKSTSKCFNCNEAGHISTNCPKPRREKGSCFRCGQIGHTVIGCQQSSSILLVQETVLEMEKPKPPCSYIDEFHNVFQYDFEDDLGAVCMTMNALTLIDTGSPINFVQQRYVPEFLMTSEPPPCQNFVGINNSKIIVLGSVLCKVKTNNNCVNVRLFVVKNDTMQDAFVLGRDFLKKMNVKLVFEKNNTNLFDNILFNNILSRNSANCNENSRNNHDINDPLCKTVSNEILNPNITQNQHEFVCLITKDKSDNTLMPKIEFNEKNICRTISPNNFLVSKINQNKLERQDSKEIYKKRRRRLRRK